LTFRQLLQCCCLSQNNFCSPLEEANSDTHEKDKSMNQDEGFYQLSCICHKLLGATNFYSLLVAAAASAYG